MEYKTKIGISDSIRVSITAADSYNLRYGCNSWWYVFPVTAFNGLNSFSSNGYTESISPFPRTSRIQTAQLLWLSSCTLVVPDALILQTLGNNLPKTKTKAARIYSRPFR